MQQTLTQRDEEERGTLCRGGAPLCPQETARKGHKGRMRIESRKEGWGPIKEGIDC